MQFFGGSEKTSILRELLPYFLALIGMAAVLVYFLHVTGLAVERRTTENETRAVTLAGDLGELCADSSIAPEMFNAFDRNGSIRYELREEFTTLLGLSEYVLDLPLGDEFEVFPYRDDSLALSALATGEPELRPGTKDGSTGMTVYLPTRPGQDGPMAMARAQFPGSEDTEWREETRYNFFMSGIAIVILIIIPALLLRLSKLRRMVDVQQFSGDPFKSIASISGEKGHSSDYPDSLFNTPGAPVMLRLDDEGRITDLSISALEMLDLSREAAAGAVFHELPVVRSMGVQGPHRLNGVDELRPGTMTIVVESSDGGSSEVVLAVAMLPGGGRVLMGHAAGSDDLVENLERPPLETGPARMLSADDTHTLKDLLGSASDLPSGSAERSRTLEKIASLLHVSLAVEADVPVPEETGIQLSLELESIASALNDVLPERATIQVETPGLLPTIGFSRQNLTQVLKNLVFYSLESVPGPVRIKLSTREVPSPSSDPVFSSRCGLHYQRSVALSYTDRTRMPVRLKEALLDPDTDSAGIQRDFGSHISSAASVISGLECAPVLTEGTMGTTLHMLFTCDDTDLFPGADGELPIGGGTDLTVVLCDGSRTVRESVSDTLEAYGMTVHAGADIDSLMETLPDDVSGVVLDFSVLEMMAESTVFSIRRRWPDAVVILTSPSPSRGSESESKSESKSELDELELNEELHGLPVVHKPYSPHQIIEILGSSRSVRDG